MVVAGQVGWWWHEQMMSWMEAASRT